MATKKTPEPRQHGIKGVYYGGDWLDIENCSPFTTPSTPSHSTATWKDRDHECTIDCDHSKDNHHQQQQPEKEACKSCSNNGTSKCPRSKSRPAKLTPACAAPDKFDVVIVGSGCIGSAIARTLSKYVDLRVLLVDSSDDVSQGATKGNSGIVHAGFDDTPGTNRAKFCWKGNQMFRGLDEELRFGYQVNGSLVVAFNDEEREHLMTLLKRGETNGIERLRIVEKEELFKMEPHLNPKAICALYSPDAGNVIPYEYAIALAENAIDNGVELRLRREVTDIVKTADGEWDVKLRCWEPKDYVEGLSFVPPAVEGGKGEKKNSSLFLALFGAFLPLLAAYLPATKLNEIKFCSSNIAGVVVDDIHVYSAFAVLGLFSFFAFYIALTSKRPSYKPSNDINKIYADASLPLGTITTSKKVTIEEMKTGGTGSWNAVQGQTVNTETITCKYIINCSGSSSDKIAAMINDLSFKIKPRLGDYLLMNRSQGHLVSSTLFPCPSKLGKGVLCQTTLWGNLILGPTARDYDNAEHMSMTDNEIQDEILEKCKLLIPEFDSKEVIHTFCGSRAKSDRGDWIIERSKVDKTFVNVAGIDSPGLAGSPAIALEVLRILVEESGLTGLTEKPNWNPNRAPIITVKDGLRGLKMTATFEKSIGLKQSENVVCKCERVTELEIVTAISRGIPIDSTQALRKRTRAGMGHCQASVGNYNCECRVKAVIARENGEDVKGVGGRPWPGTSILKGRWGEGRKV